MLRIPKHWSHWSNYSTETNIGGASKIWEIWAAHYRGWYWLLIGMIELWYVPRHANGQEIMFSFLSEPMDWGYCMMGNIRCCWLLRYPGSYWELKPFRLLSQMGSYNKQPEGCPTASHARGGTGHRPEGLDQCFGDPWASLAPWRAGSTTWHQVYNKSLRCSVYGQTNWLQLMIFNGFSHVVLW